MVGSVEIPCHVWVDWDQLTGNRESLRGADLAIGRLDKIKRLHGKVGGQVF